VSALSTMVMQLAAVGVLMLVSVFYWWRRANARRIQTLDAKKDYNEIARLLCTQEFPFEWYYGINIAFYRTFSSPTISSLYYNNGTIEKTAEKRVIDTDIIMWQPIEHGVDSEEGTKALLHLNDIHAVFKKKTQNADFVYVLCCFIKDILGMIELTGWRRITEHEKEALFNFWIRYGEVMQIKDLPKTLPEALQLVDDYVESDRSSKLTKGGSKLTTAITALLCKWFWGVPDVVMHFGVTALLYIVGGKIFVHKLGLPQPYKWLVYLLYSVGYLFGTLVSVTPPRRPYIHSEECFKKYYSGCPMGKNFIKQVGPVEVLEKIVKDD